jgi:hypothetical protein
VLRCLLDILFHLFLCCSNHCHYRYVISCRITRPLLVTLFFLERHATPSATNLLSIMAFVRVLGMKYGLNLLRGRAWRRKALFGGGSGRHWTSFWQSIAKSLLEKLMTPVRSVSGADPQAITLGPKEQDMNGSDFKLRASKDAERLGPPSCQPLRRIAMAAAKSRDVIDKGGLHDRPNRR